MQLIRARFPHLHGDFVVRRLSSMLRRKLSDVFIPLLATL